MPIIAREVTDKEVRAMLKKPGTYRVGGCAGLVLRVSAVGTGAWVLRSWVKGKWDATNNEMSPSKRRDIRLGHYPGVTLKAARELGHEKRSLIFTGIDPNEQRRLERKAKRTELRTITFDDAAKAYLDEFVTKMKNPKHRQQWENTLATYASPFIGKLAVADIDLEHMKKLLRQPTEFKGKKGTFWEVKNESASRVRGRVEAILDWCKTERYRAGENPATWQGNLSKVFAKPSQVKEVKHHAAVPYAEIYDVMKELQRQSGHGSLATIWTILTAARSGETRGMKWEEIDRQKKVWTVPGERMKKGKEHRVPLSDAALALLDKTITVPDCDYVFPSATGKMLSDATMKECLRRMGREETIHGFRSSFRDWAGDETMHPRELIEVALAHVPGDKSESAYWRSDVMEKRRALMNDWAKWCATKPKS